MSLCCLLSSSSCFQALKERALASLCRVPVADALVFDTSVALPAGCSIKSGAIEGYARGGAEFGNRVRVYVQ